MQNKVRSFIDLRCSFPSFITCIMQGQNVRGVDAVFKKKLQKKVACKYIFIAIKVISIAIQVSAMDLFLLG